MTTETCSTVTEACAEALSPAELIAARARRDRIENAELDREAEEHNCERSETLTEALARIAGKGASNG